MSEQLFTPVYTVEGVSYNKAPRSNGIMSVEPQVMTVGGGKALDANRYATKKTIAQGMLDIALLTANASQLKYVLRLGERHEFYTLMLGLIITSLILQLVVGLLSLSLSMLRDCLLHLPHYNLSATVISTTNMIFVYIITVINVLIVGFGVFPANMVASF